MSLRTLLLRQLPRTFYHTYRHHPVVPTLQPPPHNLNLCPKRFKHKAIKCWQCGIERKNPGELFCEQCSFIQSPPEKDNYFKVFELEEKFAIDQKLLTSKYRQMQSVLHPDKFSNKSDTEKDISAEFSSLVNKAYNTLQTPLKRAIHLLHLKGGVIEEDQRVEDPEFLMEIMKLNEEVENADSDDKLKKLKLKNDSELAKIADEINKCFETNEINKAKENIIKMKYFNSVSLHINNLIREKGITE
ncbi:iron-sulfur cluster co-chaperone protein HscB [Tribolium madens]|uniref:iron-sulfur cluster co-chaperone protein HscB n=1 Tax=Tribolium madens TaxID=41895 RepID=UPI001CF74EA3|nr:iron-sulfur cluster co-chaperone protein HscB [Tribolium madens]